MRLVGLRLGGIAGFDDLALSFEDDGGLALVGTCWQSGNYFVLRTAL